MTSAHPSSEDQDKAAGYFGSGAQAAALGKPGASKEPLQP